MSAEDGERTTSASACASPGGHKASTARSFRKGAATENARRRRRRPCRRRPEWPPGGARPRVESTPESSTLTTLDRNDRMCKNDDTASGSPPALGPAEWLRCRACPATSRARHLPPSSLRRTIEPRRTAIAGPRVGCVGACGGSPPRAVPGGSTRWRPRTGSALRRALRPEVPPGSPGHGERVKTDRRDASRLALLFRAGQLPAVRVPTVAEEVVRDLCRARADMVIDQTRARHRLGKFLLRHGRVWRGGTTGPSSTWRGCERSASTTGP